MGEFDVIERYFNLQRKGVGVEVGIGDDCALLSSPPNTRLAVSIDTLVEGTHFLPETSPADLASRLLGAATSDLAAMGATPAWLTLALSLPDSDPEWLSLFTQRLHQECEALSLNLIGGDTTRGPLVLTAQVHGHVPAHKGLVRSGAQVDEYICVSGTLGDSRAGLALQLDELSADTLTSENSTYLKRRFFRPTPRLTLGQALLNHATSCIDVSDGLLADLNHILKASGVGANLDLAKLPISDALRASVTDAQAREWALTGGEDFELCFTLPKPLATPAFLDALPCPVSIIGETTAGVGIRSAQPLPSSFGFDHFNENP